MKKRVLLRVAYDGTNYHGWQVQPGAVTIEQVLNEKLTELLGEPIEVIGASRTDSGVHAMGNVAVFDTEHRMPADKICFALNQKTSAFSHLWKWNRTGIRENITVSRHMNTKY